MVQGVGAGAINEATENDKFSIVVIGHFVVVSTFRHLSFLLHLGPGESALVKHENIWVAVVSAEPTVNNRFVFEDVGSVMRDF